jgi:hypothetical protein
METYLVKMELNAQIDAFNENDAVDYINDIFGIDDEIKSIKIIGIKKK